MRTIIEDLAPLNRVFCSSDFDVALKYLQGHLPFEIVSFDKTKETNGWVIPPKWDVVEAKILKENEVVYDAMKNPLCVIALSSAVDKLVSLEELKRHLHFDRRYDDAIPYHFRQMYRSWDRDWGFAVTKRFYDTLTPGSYRAIIKTNESEGELKLLRFQAKGRLPQGFVFVAHLDHPGMANDDLAGCAVGIQLFKQLRSRQTKYSYTLLLVPEIIGSELYLSEVPDFERGNILEGVFLEALGSNTQLSLQDTLSRNSIVVDALETVMKDASISHRRGPFKSIICNDEGIWETYGIPMASFSRFPYPEYHTHHDNISIILDSALNEAVSILERAINRIEESKLVSKNFRGNVCLSNPKYNLYVDPGQPAFGTVAGEELQRMRFVMDLIPTIKGPVTVDWIARMANLPEHEVLTYLEGWQKKGLLDLR